MGLFSRRKSKDIDKTVTELLEIARRPAVELAQRAVTERDADRAILSRLIRQLEALTKPGGKQVTFVQLRDLIDDAYAGRVDPPEGILDLGHDVTPMEVDEIRRRIGDVQTPTNVVVP